MDQGIDEVGVGRGSGAGASGPFDSYDLSHVYHGSSGDILDMVRRFDQWHRRAVPGGYHLYSQALQEGAEPTVRVRTRKTGKVRDLINLSSYNYLGISQRPEVRSAAVEALERYGLGASGSPLLSGTMDVHEELAHELSKFKKQPSTILFPTGYSASVGLISALMRPGDTVFCDQYCHASAVDGAILSKSKTVFFRHNDPSDLDRRLRRAQGRKLVVVEGVYSMDGDLCPLPQIVKVAARHGARILIDEAHSAFVFGEDGRGVAEHFGLEHEIDFHLGTLSKALGGQGGYVCASEEVTGYANAYGRARLFSCNLAPPVAAGVLAGLRIATAEPNLRAQLWRNVRHLRRRLAEEAVNIGRSASQIISVMVNDDVRIFPLTEKLQERGLFLPPVIYPAVSKNRSRLRIAVSAAHPGPAGGRGPGDRGDAPRGRDHRRMTQATYVAQNTFSEGVGVFCTLPTEDARRLLPPHLTPMELRHGSAILSAAVFDFTDGPAGPYRELVMSIHVAPLLEAGRALPNAALYPFHLGSTTLQPVSTPSTSGTFRTGVSGWTSGCASGKERSRRGSALVASRSWNWRRRGSPGRLTRRPIRASCRTTPPI